MIQKVIQTQKKIFFKNQKKQNQIVIEVKKKLNKIDKASQTDINHYQNLMLEEEVLQRIEGQIKSIRKPNSDILGFKNNQEIITNYQDVPLQEGLKNSFNKLIFLYNKSQARYRFIMLKFRTKIPYRTNLPLNQTNQLLQLSKTHILNNKCNQNKRQHHNIKNCYLSKIEGE
ncbi:unnamed protein product [Paramecium primaurelia]|uniref:Uncharacterized protein n=1 Tax=Paramecium primaurelia TaxID=5886 RepID=A0A8S1PGI3_PARPR|nr:unnamed protein product [Paramecium primaurelia]